MSAVVFISHHVTDFDRWKKAFDQHGAAREKAGFKLAALGRDVTNPNLVHIAFYAPSLEAARAFATDPTVNASLDEGVVVGTPDVRIAHAIKTT
jgi:hypothetical protein